MDKKKQILTSEGCNCFSFFYFPIIVSITFFMQNFLICIYLCEYTYKYIHIYMYIYENVQKIKNHYVFRGWFYLLNYLPTLNISVLKQFLFKNFSSFSFH